MMLCAMFVTRPMDGLQATHGLRGLRQIAVCMGGVWALLHLVAYVSCSRFCWNCWMRSLARIDALLTNPFLPGCTRTSPSGWRYSEHYHAPQTTWDERESCEFSVGHGYGKPGTIGLSELKFLAQIPVFCCRPHELIAARGDGYAGENDTERLRWNWFWWLYSCC